MSGRRYISSDAFPFRKDADGKPLCRYCGSPVKPPRRSWCSQECVDEFLLRSSGSALRSAVFRRDKGICAACGCDAQKIERIAADADLAYSKTIQHPPAACWGWWKREIFAVFARMGFNYNQSFWEADHILEVSAGGETTLDNTQTLCVPCHKEKTRKMHADRKFERTGIRPKPPVRETQLSML